MPAPRDALEAVTHADPYPYDRSLREAQPLFFDAGLGLWVASSHAAVYAALRHPALCVRPPDEPVPKALQGGVAGQVFAQLVRMTDGDFHAVHKPGVELDARRWQLADAARAAEDAVQDLVPRLAVNDFLTALPVHTMARLLGVPASEREPTCRWVAQFTQGIASGAGAQAVARAHQAAEALMAQGQALGLPPAQAANRIAFMQQPWMPPVACSAMWCCAWRKTRCMPPWPMPQRRRCGFLCARLNAGPRLSRTPVVSRQSHLLCWTTASQPGRASCCCWPASTATRRSIRSRTTSPWIVRRPAAWALARVHMSVQAPKLLLKQ